METSKRTLKNLFLSRHKQILWGAGFGMLWGFLVGGGTTPRAVVTIDQVNHIVTIKRAALSSPVTVSLDVYSSTYLSNLLQVTIVYLLLCFAGGWVACQLSRIRPRGQQQPRLGEAWYIFFVAFYLGGLAAFELFQMFHLGDWFIGDPPTVTVIATALISFILPLFAGLGAVFVWLLRLPSVRAPDWERHIPPYGDWLRPLVRDLVQKVRTGGKGGVKSK
jgi:hypothetical protein